MIKIENEYVNVVKPRDGWYIDKEGDLWYFEFGKAIVILNEKEAFSSQIECVETKDYEPFTRLTGRVIITND